MRFREFGLVLKMGRRNWWYKSRRLVGGTACNGLVLTQTCGPDSGGIVITNLLGVARSDFQLHMFCFVSLVLLLWSVLVPIIEVKICQVVKVHLANYVSKE